MTTWSNHSMELATTAEISQRKYNQKKHIVRLHDHLVPLMRSVPADRGRANGSVAKNTRESTMRLGIVITRRLHEPRWSGSNSAGGCDMLSQRFVYWSVLMSFLAESNPQVHQWVRSKTRVVSCTCMEKGDESRRYLRRRDKRCKREERREPSLA